MGRKGHELDKLMDELAADGAREKPMSESDATGAPPVHRHDREIANAAWAFIERYATDKEPMPGWVVDYLKSVAQRIGENRGPGGALSRDAAHLALRIDGKAWPEHAPVRVYLAMQAWIDDPDVTDVTGPKSAAVRYIRKHMGDDKSVKVNSVIKWYKSGKAIWIADG